MSDELKALQERREKMKREYAEAEAKQAAIDLAALVSAEEEFGFGEVESLKVPSFKPGLPTLAIVRSAGGTHFYKAYLHESINAKSAAKKTAAVETLGTACMVYPPPGELRDKMAEAFPGMLASAGLAVVRLADLASDAEKKD